MRIPENRVCEILSAVSKIPEGKVATYGQIAAPNFSEQRALLENEGVEFKSNGLVDVNKYSWHPNNGY